MWDCVDAASQSRDLYFVLDPWLVKTKQMGVILNRNQQSNTSMEVIICIAFKLCAKHVKKQLNFSPLWFWL